MNINLLIKTACEKPVDIFTKTEKEKPVDIK